MDVSPSGLLLSIADRRVAQRLDAGEFERVLLNAILFEPEIVISDVYFFNSPIIFQHITQARGGLSLIEEALRQSVIVPALREPADSFRQVAAYLRRDGIYGLLPREQVDYLAERLSGCTRSQSLSMLWPEKMSKSYAATLINVLQQDSPPGRDCIQIDEKLWARTERFRFVAIDDAVEEEANRPGGYGVRRAEIIRKVGEQIGVVQPGGLLPAENEIIRMYDASPEERRAVGSFFNWLDELYFTNQALRFGVRPTTSTRNVADMALIAAAIEGFDLIQEQVADVHSTEQRIDITIELPSFDSLAKLKPEVLLGLRQYGRDWYAAAGVFMHTPNTYTRMKAEWALENFARKLREKIHRAPEDRADVSVASKEFAYSLASAVAGFVQAAVGLPPFHTLISVARSGYIMMRYRKKIDVDLMEMIRAPNELSRFVTLGRSQKAISSES